MSEDNKENSANSVSGDACNVVASPEKSCDSTASSAGAAGSKVEGNQIINGKFRPL